MTRCYHNITHNIRSRILSAYLYDAWALSIRRCQQVAEVEIVREDNEPVIPRKHHDLCIRSTRIAKRRPMLRFDSPARKELDPVGAQVHVDEQFHVASGTSYSSERHAA